MAKGMDRKQFNEVMKRCRDNYNVRYVSPIMHPRANIVTAFTIWTADDVVQFSITNNPDENFDLYIAVNNYLDGLGSIKDDLFDIEMANLMMKNDINKK